MILVAEGVAGFGFFKTDEGYDIACNSLLNFYTLFCFDFEDTADTLFFAFVCIFEAHTGFDNALEYAGEYLLTYEGVVDEFECKSGYGSVLSCFYNYFF